MPVSPFQLVKSSKGEQVVGPRVSSRAIEHLKAWREIRFTVNVAITLVVSPQLCC